MEVGDKLDEWQQAGLIDGDTAAAIRRHEESTRDETPRIPPIAEAVGYLGAVLAGAAVVVLFGQSWVDIGVEARLAVALACAVLTLLAGVWLGPFGEPALRRLAGVTWLLSVAAVAWMIVMVARDVLEWGAGGGTTLVGTVTTAYAALLYWRRRTGWQHVGLAAGVGALLVGVLVLAGDGGDALVGGMVVWGAGVLWSLLGRTGKLPPERVALLVGAVAMVAGAITAGVGDTTEIGLALGLGTAVVLLAVGTVADRTELVVAGTIAAFIFVPWAITHFFADTAAAAVTLLAAGGVLVAGAVFVVRRRRGSSR